MSKKLNLIILSGVVAAASAGISATLTSSAVSNKADTVLLATAATGSEVSTLLDETVYVFTEPNGAVRRVISSDWTKTALGTDQYTKVEKADHSTPLSLAVKYTLDGQEVSAKDLVGKSGKVTIKYNYTNNQKVGGYYVPYAVITGLILDNDHFENVAVENARLINDGSRTVVAGLALPGMQENLALSNDTINLPDSFTITADVKDFQLGMSMSLATTELFKDIDTSSLDSVNELSSQLNKLTDGIDQLMSGSSKLYDGLAELNDKSGALTAGINKLTAGSAELSSGLGSVDTGAASLQSGVSGLSDGLAQLAAGASSIFDSTLSSTRTNIVSQIKLYATSSYISGAIDLPTMQTLIANADAIPEFTQSNYEATLDYLASTQPAFAEQFTTAKTQLNNYRDNFLTNLSTASLQVSNMLLPGINDLKDGTEQLYAGSITLSNGLTELNNSTPALISGIAQLKSGSGDLRDGLTKFNDEGVQKLVDAYGSLQNFTSRLKDIVNVAKNSSSTKYIYRVDEVK